MGVGLKSEGALSGENLADFLSRMEEFRLRIATTEHLLRASPEEVLVQICDEIVAVF